MDDVQKTKKQLTVELTESRRRISELEKAAEERDKVEALREALSHSKNFLDSLINGIADPIFVKDENHRWIALNDSFCKMIGHTREEMIGKSDFDLFPKEQAEVFWAHDDMTLTSNEMDVNEEEITGADGIRMISTVKTSFVNPVTGRRNIVGAIRDITDGKLTEKALLESEAKFKTISNQSMMGIIILQDESFVYVNDQAAAIMEVPVEKIEGWVPGQYAALIHPEDRAFVMEQGRKKQGGEKGAVTGYSWRMITPKGNLKWIEMWSESTPYKGRTADLVAIVDITEKKTLENQLLQSQKMEAIGRLAGGVAHDFNNLLTVILNNTEVVLKENDLADSLRGDLGEVMNAARRAADLTKQLLAFSRKQTISLRVLDLNTVVERSLKMVRRLIGEDIDLLFVPGEKLEKVEVDPVQVDQILLNLAVNAQDAMPAGGKLTLETRNSNQSGQRCRKCGEAMHGNYVRLTISDDGCGMDLNIRDQIFEPFFTTKDKGQGTGLGLSMVYGIVHQHKGHINVYSKPRDGTTFKIYFPATQIQAKKIVKSIAPAPARNTETILLVEDDDPVRRVTAKILKMKGYTILEASNPYEALRLASEHAKEIDIVLTDVVMPGMSGRECMEQLWKTIPGLKVLFMSGYSENVVGRNGILDEGVSFIQKPFGPEDLARKLREVLDSRAG